MTHESTAENLRKITFETMAINSILCSMNREQLVEFTKKEAESPNGSMSNMILIATALKVYADEIYAKLHLATHPLVVILRKPEESDNQTSSIETTGA